MLYSASKAKTEAWDFATNSCTRTSTAHAVRSGRGAAARHAKEAIVKQDYYTKNPDLSTFAAGLGYAKFRTPTVKDWAEIADITTRSLQSIYLGEGDTAGRA